MKSLNKIVSVDRRRTTDTFSSGAIADLYGFWMHDVRNQLMAFRTVAEYIQFEPAEISEAAYSLLDQEQLDRNVCITCMRGVLKYFQGARDRLTVFIDQHQTHEDRKHFQELINFAVQFFQITEIYLQLLERGEYQLIPIEIWKAKSFIGGGFFKVQGNLGATILASPPLYRIMIHNLYNNAGEAQLATGTYTIPEVHVHIENERVYLKFRNKGQIPPPLLEVDPIAKRQRIFIRGTTTKENAAGEHGMGGAIIYDMATLMDATLYAENEGDQAIITVTFKCVG